jgi:hypothetical protein
VLHSRWAYWFGIPVSGIALLVYGAIFTVTFRLGLKSPPLLQRKAWAVLIPCAIVVVGAALWFVCLQLFAIKTVCPFCMTLHGLGLASALLLLFNAPLRAAPDKPWQKEKTVFVPPDVAKKLSLVALFGLALLAGGQTLHQPKTYQVQPIGSGPASPAVGTQAIVSSNLRSGAPVNAAGQALGESAKGLTSGPNQAKAVRFFQIYDGLFQFDMNEVPVIGSPAAPRAMVSLFDYTCKHCRLMHHHLLEVHREFSNQLAIVSLPMPFDPSCNYTVKRRHPDHTNACEYARIGLAVWRADRSKQPEFDDWLFAPPRPPSLTITRQFAAGLVGSNAFEKAFEDKWVTEQIQRDVTLYATNYIHFQIGDLPQVIIGSNVVHGSISGAADLYPVLERQLGLKLAPSVVH